MEEKKSIDINRNTGHFKKGKPRAIDAGRRKGTPNKRTEELSSLVAAADFTPFEFLVRAYTNTLFNREGAKLEVTMDQRIVCAKELCQFLMPKKRSVEVSGSVTVDKTPAEDAYLIDVDIPEEEED